MRLRPAEPTPALQGASLVGEYALCRRSFGWTDAMIKSVAQTSKLDPS